MSPDHGHANQSDEMVYFGSDCSMPRDLHVRSRRLLWLHCKAAAAMPALFLLGELVPTQSIVWLAEHLNRLFWIHLKPISLIDCVETCHMMAYSMVAVPASWIVTIIVAIKAAPYAKDFWQARQDALRQGAAPMGRTTDGRIRQLPSLAYGIWASVGLLAAFLVIEFLLYELAGSDSTVSRGRRISPPLVSLYTTALMSCALLSAGAAMSALALVTRILSAPTNDHRR